MVRVKICCIADIVEGRMAHDAGAAAIGLVSHMPSGPGVIDEYSINIVAEWAPPGLGTFLLTSLTSVPDIVAQHRRCRTNTIQLCDALTEGSLSDLHRELPGIKIVQVIHVWDEDALVEAKDAAENVHALLLDSGRPKAEVKTLGGTGQVHNWDISREIVRSVSCPVFLAGGLRADNVGDAIRHVRPYGLDLCSSVRTDDRLDQAKLTAFFEAVRAAG